MITEADPHDGPIQCSECAGPLEEVLVLPGGQEVLGREVYFSADVVGVSAYERCRDCGARYD